MPDPLDLFYIHNPDQLFGPIQEEILITLNNRYITKNHLCCASKEIPIKINEYEKFGVLDKDFFIECLEDLVSESLLMKKGDRYYWNSDFFPNQKYGLNDLSARSYKVILRTDSNEELLTVEDESFVFRDLHPGAVYLYEAESYVVDELDLEERVVYLSKKNVDFYTQSLRHTDITPLDIVYQNERGLNIKIDSYFGNVKVEHEYYSYKVVDTLTQDIRSRHPLEDIPIISFESMALWFTVPFEYQKELEIAGYDLGGTIHAIEHAMIAMSPALAQISRWDLGGVSIDFDPVKQQPIIYIYDAYRGGIGISETLYFNLNDLMKLAYKLIKSCNCNSNNGCPACIMSPKCGNSHEPLDKAGALFLLGKLIDGI